MRTGAGTISRQGRSTQGVQVMNVDDGDHVASVARVDQAEGDPDGHDADTADVEVIDASATPEVNGERSEEHTSELQSLMRISYAVFCLKKKKEQKQIQH